MHKCLQHAGCCWRYENFSRGIDLLASKDLQVSAALFVEPFYVVALIKNNLL